MSWDRYFYDLYGTPANMSILSKMNWFYWSAPFAPESLRVYMSNPKEQGDAYIGMYPNLGFVMNHNNNYVNRIGNWVEVLRCGSPGSGCHGMSKETHICGMWYYNLRGTGVWLSMGNTKYIPTKTKHDLELGVCQKGVKWATSKYRTFDTVLAPWHRNTNFVVTVDMRDHNLLATDYNTYTSIACGGVRKNVTWLRSGSHAEWPCKCNEESVYANCRASHIRLQRYPKLKNDTKVRGRCDGNIFTLPCKEHCHKIVHLYCSQTRCTECFMYWPPKMNHNHSFAKKT